MRVQGVVVQTRRLVFSSSASGNLGIRVLLVAQGDLGGREGGLVPRAVGADLVALVEEVLFVQALQGPPDALDVGVVEGPVGVVHVYPETEALAHRAPLLDVAED